MQWALIATQNQSLTLYIPPVINENNIMISEGYYETIQAVPGTIINIIIYNGVSPYIPLNNVVLQQVPDDAKIGDTGYPV